MRVYQEITIDDFEFWSGAIDTFEKVEEAGKVEELEGIIEELYPEGIDGYELNDLLWFDSEWIFETLGISEEEEEEEEEEEGEE